MKEDLKFKPWLNAHTAEEKVAELPKGTAYDYLYNNNKNYGEHDAIIYFDRKISYNELFKNIEQTTKALKAAGIKKGDIVTMCVLTTPEVVYLFYALSRIGAVVNTIDPRTSIDGIKKYIEEVKSKFVVTLDALAPKINAVDNLIDNNEDDFKVEQILSISPLDSLPVPIQVASMFKDELTKAGRQKKIANKSDKYIRWKDFIDNGADYLGVLDEPYEENRLFGILHTGGSTGFPKGAMHSNESFNALAHSYKYSGHDIRPGHTFLNIMPPFIAYGLSAGVHMPLCLGITNIIIPKFDPKDFDKLLVKYHPNHWAGVPSHLQGLLDSKLLKKPENWDMSYLVCVGVGGDGLNPKVEEEINKFLAEHNCRYKIAPGYGMTELNSAFSTVLGKFYKPCSGGIPFAKNDVKVMDPETKNPRSVERLPIGKEGELYLSGPSIMMGYYNNPEETKETLIIDENGQSWIRSGDLGYIDEIGNVFPTGRIKNAIIRHDGFKIFTNPIESVIMSHNGVANCKVVGVRDYDYAQGELPKVHVTLKPEYIGKEIQIENELKELCKSKLPEYTLPVCYKFRSDFPLTNVGKIDILTLKSEDDGIDYKTGLKYVDANLSKDGKEKRLKSIFRNVKKRK